MAPSPADALLGNAPPALLAELARDPLLANRYAGMRNGPTKFTDPLGQIPILTVLQGLGYAATIMAVVSFYTLIGLAVLGGSLFLAGERQAAHDIGEIMVGLAIATLGFIVVGAILAPEVMAVLAYQEYWWVGVTLLFLGCAGYAGMKLQSSGLTKGWSTLAFCVMRFYRAWTTRDPSEFFKQPGEC